MAKYPQSKNKKTVIEIEERGLGGTVVKVDGIELNAWVTGFHAEKQSGNHAVVEIRLLCDELHIDGRQRIG